MKTHRHSPLRAAIERARPQWERAQRQVMQRIGTERAALIRGLAAELGEGEI